MLEQNDINKQKTSSDEPDYFTVEISGSRKSNEPSLEEGNLRPGFPNNKFPKQNQKFDAVFLGEILLNLIVIIFIVVILRSYIIAPFKVSGSSMCNTLNYIKGECEEGTGEYIIINKIGYLNLRGYEIGSPQRGDIIVFLPDNEKEDFYIKRIIGVPGDTVRISKGKVYLTKSGSVEEEELKEEYLSESNKDRTMISSKQSSFLVPVNNYFVMGDNRRQSNDSRQCFSQHGCRQGSTHFVERSRIQGKAWIVFWPLRSIRLIKY